MELLLICKKQKGIVIMEEKTKKEMLKLIDITRESIKNEMEVSLETYAEVFSKLDVLSYLILSERKISQKPE